MSDSQKELSIACVLLLSACGAILNGPTTRVEFERASSDVTYVVDGGRVPKTVMSLPLSNFDTHTVVALLPDGRSAEMKLKREFSGAALALDLLWCLTLAGIAAPIADAVMESWFYLTPDRVRLEPITPPKQWADLSFEATELPRFGIAVVPKLAPVSHGRKGKLKKKR